MRPLERGGVGFEVVEGELRVWADFDEVAVGIADVAALFPAVIVEGFGEKKRSFVAPQFVAGPDVGYAQVQEAADGSEIRGNKPPQSIKNRSFSSPRGLSQTVNREVLRRNQK
jgi:hypothetical protein